MAGQKHPLKNKWLVSYIPVLTAEVLEKHRNDYDAATRAVWRKVDFITTVEELWSTVNSLPQWTALPARDQMIFSREQAEPFFQTFPNGCRISIYTEVLSAGKSALDAVFVHVIGEGITAASEGVSVIDLIRIMRKPNAKSNDAMHIELWLNDKSRKDPILKFLRDEIHKDFPTTKVEESVKK